MRTNGKQELLAQIARRSLVLVGLLGMATICAGSGRAESSAATTSTQDLKPLAAPSTTTQAPTAIAKPATAQEKSPVSPVSMFLNN